MMDTYKIMVSLKEGYSGKLVGVLEVRYGYCDSVRSAYRFCEDCYWDRVVIKEAMFLVGMDCAVEGVLEIARRMVTR